MKHFTVSYLLSAILLAGCGSLLSVHAFEPISTGLAGITIAGLYAGYMYFRHNLEETCTREYVDLNLRGLAADFRSNFYGQHLVEDIVLKVLKIHITRATRNKPLVMSFHGWTGGGKNFVSKLIAHHMYKESIRSNFFHLFIANVHFKHQHLAKQYKDDLQSWIKGNVSRCAWSIFVFDEVDKMPTGVLDAIKPFVDYYDSIDRVDYRKSIFIFLSNTGGREITEKMLTLWHQGRVREEITYDDLEDLMAKGAFNEEGGLFHTDIIDKNLIDYYVPFLPLEKRHVKQCIKAELRVKRADITDQLVDKIANSMAYFPADTQLFSQVGCKRVAEKVQFYLD